MPETRPTDVFEGLKTTQRPDWLSWVIAVAMLLLAATALIAVIKYP